jgi:hypothetical protein
VVGVLVSLLGSLDGALDGLLAVWLVERLVASPESFFLSPPKARKAPRPSATTASIATMSPMILPLLPSLGGGGPYPPGGGGPYPPPYCG